MFEKKVLITGGAGFIGSHLANEILKRNGSMIYILDNFSSNFYHKPKLNYQIDQQVGNVDDINTINYYLEKVKKIDYIFHLASPASPEDFIKRPMDIFAANVMGTRNMLELARRNDCPFLFASSSEIYGQVPLKNIPTPEDYFGNTNPIGVRCCYDEAKRCGEAMTTTYHRLYGLDTKIARIFNTYGPSMTDDGRVISTFVHRAIEHKPLPVQGNGKQTRSFLYIDDLVNGLIALIKSEINFPINLGSPEEISVLDLAYLILKLMGETNTKKNIEYIKRFEDDPEHRRPDIWRAELLLQWKPKVKLAEGLKKTIDAYIIEGTSDLFR